MIAEREWLTSTDPAAMVQCLTREFVHTAGSGGTWIPRKTPLVSGRRMRLLDEAMFARFGLNLDDVAAPQSDRTPGSADVIRCIVGNPFHPVVVGCPILDGLKQGKGKGPNTVWTDPDWLTPTVVALAKAAYEERGQQCKTCYGDGYVPAGLGGEYRSDCPPCNNTGRIDDGTLDNHRLAVLSDALEDAGCNEVVCRCESESVRIVREAGCFWSCSQCNGTGRVPHPLLAHLRGPGPHFRGCWAIDLLTGRE